MDVGDNSICVVARNFTTLLGRILEEVFRQGYQVSFRQNEKKRLKICLGFFN